MLKYSRRVKSRRVKSRRVKSRRVKSRRVKSRRVNFNMSPSRQEVDDQSVILHSGVYHGRRQKQEEQRLEQINRRLEEIKQKQEERQEQIKQRLEEIRQRQEQIKQKQEERQEQLKQEQLKQEQLKQEQLQGNFIFDFDNFCHNIGLIDDLALYDELKFFVDTEQIRPKAINNTIFGSNGIFKDNSLIPSLVKDLKLSTKSKKVYDYGSHKITIYPNHIIGEGSFGQTLKASLDSEKIVVKTLHKGSNINYDKLLTNTVRETVIQSHLSCSYSRYLLEIDDMALIPSVKLIGKTSDKNGTEYYIGMDKLTQSLDDYLPRNRDDPQKIINAINSVWKLIGYLQEKERFVHRDLHTGNVMYNVTNGRFYIIDFGMSCLLDKNVINNDTLYDPIPLDGTTPWRYFNETHDTRFFLGSILDTMGTRLPKDIGKMIAKRFAYFAFTKYTVSNSNSDSSDSGSDSSDSEYSSKSDNSYTDENIFSNLYNQVYKEYDYRFSPRMYRDFMYDFDEQQKGFTPEKIAGYKARNKLQRLVKYYYGL